MTAAGTILRSQLVDRPIVTAPGVHDALTARIAERAGFEAIYLGGNALGLSLGKGQPFVTLTDTAEATARITAAVDPPLIVDIGCGFGEAAHVRGAVRTVEAAGAAAIHLDDQPYPKRAAYHRGEGTLASITETTGKLAVAAAARRDPATLLIARTDALRVTGSLDEVISRGRAFAEAGAEALLVLDLDAQRARAIRAALPDLPLVWIGGVSHPIPSRADLADAGIALALYPFNTAAAVTASVGALMATLKADGVIDQSDDLLRAMRAETLALVDMQSAWAIEATTRDPS